MVVGAILAFAGIKKGVRVYMTNGKYVDIMPSNSNEDDVEVEVENDTEEESGIEVDDDVEVANDTVSEIHVDTDIHSTTPPSTSISEYENTPPTIPSAPLEENTGVIMYSTVTEESQIAEFLQTAEFVHGSYLRSNDIDEEIDEKIEEEVEFAVEAIHYIEPSVPAPTPEVITQPSAPEPIPAIIIQPNAKLMLTTDITQSPSAPSSSKFRVAELVQRSYLSSNDTADKNKIEEEVAVEALETENVVANPNAEPLMLRNMATTAAAIQPSAPLILV